MQLNTIKFISLGGLTASLLVLASFVVVNFQKMSSELMRSTDVYIPVRESLSRAKDLLVNSNNTFDEYKAQTQNQDFNFPVLSEALKSRIKEAIANTPPTAIDPELESSLLTELDQLQRAIQGVEVHASVTGSSLPGTSYTEFQTLFNRLRDHLHRLADTPTASSYGNTRSEIFLVITRLINLLESDLYRFLMKESIPVLDVTESIDLCLVNIHELKGLSKELHFSAEDMQLTTSLVKSLKTFRAAVLLYDDEVKLDVSGANLEEITRVVNNAQQEALRIFSALHYTLLGHSNTIQLDAITSLTRLQHIFIVLTCVIVLIALSFSLWFSIFLTNRFNKLTFGAEKLEGGDLSFRFKELAKTKDQFGSLARVFNNMANALEKREVSLLENIDTIARTQKQEAIGSLAGGIAHDFNNILTAIMGYADLLMLKINQRGNEELKEDVAVIQNSSRRAKELVSQLLSFSKERESRLHHLELASLIQETTKLLKGTSPATIKITSKVAGPCFIMGDTSQIYQVLTNLGTNAIQAMSQNGGTLKINLSESTIKEEDIGDFDNLAPGHYAVILFSDTGPGIPQEYMDKIYDPYFTTKEFGSGTGLGLFVVYGIIEKHGGAINVRSKLGQGTTFEILFPLTDPPAEMKADEGLQEDSLPHGSESILFVDDEKHIRDLGKKILEMHGYKITVAKNGKKALELLQQDPKGFDLVITDQTMPKMTGIELIQTINSSNLSTPIILMTGYSEHVSHDKAKKEGVKEYILKPFDKDILNIVRKVIDQHSNPVQS